MNNIPSFLQRDDFMARHSDMVAAARGEPLTKEQIEARRKPNPYVYDKATRTLHLRELREIAMAGLQQEFASNSLFAQVMASAKDAKIGTTLRIRLPSDYKVG